MKIVDTNILIPSFLSIHIDLQEKEKHVVETLHSLDPSELIVADFVVTEFNSVLKHVVQRSYEINTRSYKFIKKSEQEYIKQLLRVALATYPTSEEMVVAIDLIGQSDLSLVDLLIYSIAKNRNLEIFSLDKKLINFAIKNKVQVVKL